MTETTTVYVCVSCKKMNSDPEGQSDIRDGAVLFDQISAEFINETHINIQPVECLSSCNFGCNIALTGSKKWSYVYGRLTPEQDVAEITEGIRAYNQSADGIVPWRERPVLFRKNSISRIPPLETKT